MFSTPVQQPPNQNGKGKKKSKRKAQEQPAALEQNDPLIIPDAAIDGKNLLELTAFELKKEVFKLGLYVDGDKPKKIKT